MNIQYTLSKEAAQKEYIETGKAPLSTKRTVTLNGATVEQRKAVVRVQPLAGEGLFKTSVTLGRVKVKHPQLASPFSGVMAPHVIIDPVEFDEAPTIDEVLEHLNRMMDEYEALGPERAAADKEYQDLLAEQKAQQEAQAEGDRQRKLLAEMEAEDRRRLLMKIPWNDDGTAVFNLHAGLITASGLEVDRRFECWIKHVAAVRSGERFSDIFAGEHVWPGTVELRRNEEATFIVAAAHGSMKYHQTEYQVVQLKDGELVKTDIADNNSTPGQWLRLRDRIAALLNVTPTDVRAEMVSKAMSYLAKAGFKKAVLDTIERLLMEGENAIQRSDS